MRHSCDNTRCVNPDHLLLGTHAENMADMKSRGRAGRRDYNRGSRHGMATLTEDLVIEIRRLYEAGTSQAELCRRFGRSPANIHSVVHRKRWTHVS